MDVRRPVELIQAGFEVAGILVLVLGAVFALISSAAALVRKRAGPTGYQVLRQHLGRAILLGLEFLVAADIIRSVALDPTFASIGILGLLVLVRTFLSWALEVEIEGAWPWQQSRAGTPASGDTREGSGLASR
jgi:uncharacterized membrane protein